MTKQELLNGVIQMVADAGEDKDALYDIQDFLEDLTLFAKDHYNAAGLRGRGEVRDAALIQTRSETWIASWKARLQQD